MLEKTTGELNQALMNQSDLDTYLCENRAAFDDRTIAEHLAALYEQKTMTKAALARKAGMSEVYLHQVFSGRRKPSRDRLLCLCIGLEASLEEAEASRLCSPLPTAQAGRHDQFLSTPWYPSQRTE